jgi:hypothetical protein
MKAVFYDYEKAVFGNGPDEPILKESNAHAMLHGLGRGTVRLDGKGEETMYFRSVNFPNIRYFTKELPVRNSF